MRSVYRGLLKLAAIGVFVVLGWLVSATPISAANITVDGVTCDLIEAIENANADALVNPDCGIGSGQDTLELTGNISLSAIYAGSTSVGGGQAGTPNITSDIVILFNGPGAVIERSATTCPSAPNFRLFYVAPGGRLTLQNLTVQNGCIQGANAWGGGIYNAGTLLLNDVTIANNTVRSAGSSTMARGGGIYNAGTITIIQDSVIEMNKVYGADAAFGDAKGGGIYNANLINLITSTTLSDNMVEAGGDAGTQNNGNGYGGGISNHGTITRLEYSNILNNEIYGGDHVQGATGGDVYGGGIYNLGNLTIEYTTIDSNMAQGNVEFSYGYGGGIANEAGALTIRNSLISNNTLATQTDGCCGGGRGGGIGIYTGTVTVINSTISGNLMTGDVSSGGGIYFLNDYGGSLTVRNSTIVNNQQTGDVSGQGSGIYGDAGMVIYSTIIANNTITAPAANGVDCFGTASWTSSGYNLIENTSNCNVTTQTSDITGGDPNLGVLANNGGSTLTHAINAGSVVIDKGNCAAASLTIDQRGAGFPRPINDLGITNAADGCDIGAFETSAVLTVTLDFQSPTGTFTEGASPNYTIPFRVVVSGGTFNGTINVNLSYGGTTTGADYTAPANPIPLTVNLATGTHAVNYDLPYTDDLLIEGTENLLLTITNANVTVGANTTHNVAVADNDSATLSLISATDSIYEPDGDQVTTVVLSALPGVTLATNVSVSFTVTQQDIDTVAADFVGATAVTPDLLFVAGEGDGATRTITTPIFDDDIAEGNEDYRLVLALDTLTPNTIAVTLGADEQIVTIVDDDVPNVLVTESASMTSVTEAVPLVADDFTVELTSDPSAVVTIELSVTDGQTRIGLPGGPYGTTLSLVFHPSSGTPIGSETFWNVPQTVEVVAVSDGLVETSLHSGSISFTVNAGNAAEYLGLSVPDLIVAISEIIVPPGTPTPATSTDNPVSSPAAVTFKDSDFIIKLVDKALAQVGDRLLYTVTFTNPKGTLLNQVVVTDVLDGRLSNLEVVSISQGSAIIKGNMVTVSGVALLPGQRITLVIAGVITSQATPGSVITNTATLESPDASIHVSNTVQTIIAPGTLPATGETPLWRTLLVLLMAVILLCGFGYKMLGAKAAQ